MKGNKLQTFRGLDRFSDALEVLDLEANEITYLSSNKDSYNSVFQLKKLRILNLSNNQISQIQITEGLHASFRLEDLTELLMRSNRLKNFKFCATLGSSKLRVLDLGHNKIYKVESIGNQADMIQELYLDKNII